MFILYQSVPRILLFRFASGMAVGLGTVIGATVLLSLIVWSLSQIEFIPIIGDWATRIAAQIEAGGAVATGGMPRDKVRSDSNCLWRLCAGRGPLDQSQVYANSENAHAMPRRWNHPCDV